MKKSVFVKTLIFVVCTMLLVSPASAEGVEGMTSKTRKQDVICMKIGKGVSFAFGKKAKIDAENPKVVPCIENGRTLVPLRFVAEALGAEVTYNEEANGCSIRKGETNIDITFDSAEFKVNGKSVTYEVPIKVYENRTMIPLRFVSEELGYHVYWNEKNSAVVISPADNPWVETREAEITALNEMLVTMLFF